MRELPLPSDPIGRNSPPFRKWAVGLGLPALLLGVGVALMGYVSFWPGVVFVYAALLWVAVDWWRLFRATALRIGGAGVAALALIAFSCAVFRPAPLLVEINVAGSGYSDGQIMGGITWGSGEGDVRVTLSNPTRLDYTDLDVTLEVGQNQTELPQIMQIAQLSAIPSVSFTSEPFPPNHVHLITKFSPTQSMRVEGIGINGVEPRYLYGEDGKGNPLKIPIIPSSTDPSPVYRIQLDKLANHTDLKLIAAVAITNPPDSTGNLPKQLFAPFETPSCIKVSGTYRVLNRPLDIKDDCHP